MTAKQRNNVGSSECRICPRFCPLERGYCQTGDGFAVAAVCLHRGEEPPVSGPEGICNVFFAHCNLQCVFCQNYQISRNPSPLPSDLDSLEKIIPEIESVLDRGARAVGFVSPSHRIPRMREIIRELRRRGRNPAMVMNTNCYDQEETIAGLEGEIDLYLPDLKYRDPDLSRRWSGAGDYPQVAAAALREMFRQKGTSLTRDADGTAMAGLIVRHLVLPGAVEDSKACLRFIAEELSPDVHVSLMAQYHPTPAVENHPELGRTLRPEEYGEVIEELERLGFRRGWTQEPVSHASYLPDFSRPGVFPG
jgi:putative pyruvate formate lyase activating enzyme